MRLVPYIYLVVFSKGFFISKTDDSQRKSFVEPEENADHHQIQSTYSKDR